MRNVLILASLVSSCFFLAAATLTAGEVAPTEKDITAAMKATWERPAAGLNEARSIEIKSIKIGAESRKWSTPGEVGGPGSKIWAAKVHFLARRHYNARTTVSDYDTYYDLTKNQLGEWVLHTSSQAGSKHTPLPDEPPTKK